MNKKGVDYVLIGAISVVIFLIVISVYAARIYSDLREDACHELGFEKFKYFDEIETCMDSEDTLYRIMMDCDWSKFPWFVPSSCEARRIIIK